MSVSEDHLAVYRELLLALHELIVHGEGDSEAADALRDQMDRPWHRMSREQQEEMRAFSERLYQQQEQG